MAELTVHVVEDPRGLVIRLAGELVMTTVGELDRHLTPICARRPAVAVVDLAGVTMVGSLGMGSLVTFQRAITRCSGEVRLAGLTGQVLDSFERARLLSLFPTYPTVNEALSHRE